MKSRANSANAITRRAARTVLFAGLLFGSLQLQAAIPLPRPPTAPAVADDIVKDFGALAQMRPRKCIDEKTSQAIVRGWHEDARQCAWQNLLEIRRWKTDQNGDRKNCLSRQALWWAWARPQFPATAGPLIWNSAWSTQGLVDDSGEKKRIEIIAREADGSWTVTEWMWKPSTRTETRKWQAARWGLLGDAAMQQRRSASGVTIPAEAAVLRTTWEKNLKGAAGEISAEGWLWERQGLCMRMETAGISQAQLHIPYSREDSRLEQRAAMQLRLARTYPQATWLTQFRLLPLPEVAARGGSKYEAIWQENDTVKGQLWMPTKSDGAIQRARIAVTLPAKRHNEADAAAVDAIARAIDRELTGLATIWTLDHE